MSVDLNPSSALSFHRPLTQTVKRTLTVSNHNSSPVIFKVKTTAPKQYCVRPNSGRIEPGESVEVQVLLQPMKEDPPTAYKCKDKFLVQSAIVPADRYDQGLPETWSSLEKEDRASIHEQKIRCAFLPPADQMQGFAEEQENGTASTLLSPDQNGAHDSTFTNASSTNNDSRFDSVRSSSTNGGDQFATPARHSVLPQQYNAEASHAPISLPSTSSSPLARQVDTFESSSTSTEAKPISQIASEASTKPVLETLKEAGTSIAASGAAAGSVIASTGAAAGAAIAEKTGLNSGYSNSPSLAKANGDDSAVVAALRKQLTGAEREIDNLRAQIKESNGLRQRNVGTTGAANSRALGVNALPTQAQVEGVPVQVVAGLCFGIFVFTWLFF